MEGFGVFVLIVIVVALLTWILTAAGRKKKDYDDSYTSHEIPPIEPPVVPKPPVTPVKKETVPAKTIATDLVQIYEYTGHGASRRCPECDGENSLCAETCHICGYSL